MGDCLNEPDSVEFEKIAGVPCSDEHEVEVFHVYTLDAAAYPTDDEFFASVVTECLEPFDTYVGIPYEASALDFSFYAPVEEAWDAGNNTVVCVLYELDGSLMTGSMRDAAR